MELNCLSDVEKFEVIELDWSKTETTIHDHNKFDLIFGSDIM